MKETRPRAVAFDADGVLQLPPSLGSWLLGFERLGGLGFLRELSTLERSTLTGERDLRPLVEDLLARRGKQATFDDVLAHWCLIRPRPGILALVDRLSDAGITCVLATNQQSYRGGFMQRTLGYQLRFVRTFYSFELGVAKPDPAYFRAIAETLNLAPSELALVDDMRANIEGARQAGLVGVHHRLWHGPRTLERSLRSLGFEF